MRNARVEALPVLERWLVNHGVPQERAGVDINHIKFFYSATLYYLRPPQMEIGISTRKPRLEKPNVLLHMIWPSNSGTAGSRAEKEEDFQQFFSEEVALPGLPAVSFGLRFCEMNPSYNSSDELIRRIAVENRARYIGIINGTISSRSWKNTQEMIGLLVDANAIVAISRTVVHQINQLMVEFPDKSQAEQRTALKQARGCLVAIRKEIAKSK